VNTKLPQGRIRLAPDVVWRRFDDQAVVLNLKTAQYHGLNDTGTRILELLEATGGDPRATVDRLAEEYGTDVEDVSAKVATFLRSLDERELIETSPPPPG
jgi:PqqD family protein of HPr-rel-A system